MAVHRHIGGRTHWVCWVIFVGLQHIYELETFSTGKVLMDILSHCINTNRTIRSCSWSPDGTLLATAGFDAKTAVWQHQGGVWEQVGF